MSLISEALRKARQEAARREATERGSPMDHPLMIQRVAPARVGASILLGGLIGGLAAIGGGLVVWWLVAGGTAPVRVPAAGQPPQVSAQPSGHDEALPPSSATGAPSTAARPVSPASERLAGGDVTEHAAPAPARAARDDDATVPATTIAVTDEPEVAAVEEASSPAETAPGPNLPASDRVFVLDAELGYASLSLGFIVFRPDDPFAEINGWEVHEGSRVEGFTVERIDQDQVRLRDERGLLVLKVR